MLSMRVHAVLVILGIYSYCSPSESIEHAAAGPTAYTPSPPVTFFWCRDTNTSYTPAQTHVARVEDLPPVVAAATLPSPESMNGPLKPVHTSRPRNMPVAACADADAVEELHVTDLSRQ
jgi:hypothetical protein